LGKQLTEIRINSSVGQHFIHVAKRVREYANAAFAIQAWVSADNTISMSLSNPSAATLVSVIQGLTMIFVLAAMALSAARARV